MLREWIGILISVHEGHGQARPGQGETWWHYFSEPEHMPLSIATLLALILLIVGLWTFLKRMVQAKRAARTNSY
ncbi:MAG: hypothetical protein JNL67_22595 [Planctomycetaceae bacterium]|nr:hypothetical protein [Planctomycetaceae bacterium]